jgi:hypothetical protein
MDQQKDDQKPAPVSRRKFIGALGAAAIAGGILQTRKAGANTTQQTTFVDSWGNTLPVAQDTLACGIFPPAPLGGANQETLGLHGHDRRGGRYRPETGGGGSCPDSTTLSSGYPKYDIQLVMVDQMRWPAWLPYGSTGWQSLFQQYLPNIYALQQYAYTFENYFTAATKCTPARATLLTGLYSQQTGIFLTGTNPGPPPLLPYSQSGFATIGDVLTQAFITTNSSSYKGYDAAWIGKWHLSAGPFQGSMPGSNGPADYGFKDKFSLPTTTDAYADKGSAVGYLSPDGYPNEGNAGNFLDGMVASSIANVGVPDYLIGGVHNYQTFPYSDGGLQPPNYTQLNDAAIAEAFSAYWLPNLATLPGAGNAPPVGQPWFCGLSFVNPTTSTGSRIRSTTASLVSRRARPREMTFSAPTRLARLDGSPRRTCRPQPPTWTTTPPPAARKTRTATARRSPHSPRQAHTRRIRVPRATYRRAGTTPTIQACNPTRETRSANPASKPCFKASLNPAPVT